MKTGTLSILAAFVALIITTARAQTTSEPATAHLEKRGDATQLIVDGKPFLVLGGETANTASSDLAYMDTVWPKLAQMHFNTVLVGVGWDWVEPVEGKYDFHLVDGLLAGARKNNLHIVFLWFGSWKNGLSSFAPAWVKADQRRFPRARLTDGKAVEVLSPFSEANLLADTRAYTAFMHHLREVDARHHTVIMIQLENEVGLLGASRDHSAGADAVFSQPVPPELMDYLQQNKETLWPALRKLWEDAGGKITGTWQEVFGNSLQADEIFMAWAYARYMNHLAGAGKSEYGVPVCSNMWIVQPEDKAPGDYPSGGPEPLVIDIWKADAPAIDINAPDIYLPNFTEWVGRFHRANNPLFVPESFGNAVGAANAFYAIGQCNGIGYSPFGVDNTERFVSGRPGAYTTTTPLVPLENLPLARAYDVLAQMTPLILDAQSKGTIGAAWLNTGHPKQDLTLGNYVVHVELLQNRRRPSQVPPMGYAIVIAAGPDEYYAAGLDMQMTFSPNTPGPEIAGLAEANTGKFVKGQWIPERQMNGDDVLLDYHQAAAAADNQSGSGLRFGPDGPKIQWVKLYRYQ
jgi:Domain of unknown function (DUF5597)/Beta-galactosidase